MCTSWASGCHSTRCPRQRRRRCGRDWPTCSRRSASAKGERLNLFHQPSGSRRRLLNMSQLLLVTGLAAGLLCAPPAYAQDDDYVRQVAQERRQAEIEAPQLAEVLGLEPGSIVADIGTGGGAMAMVLGRLVGSGRVYATDITPR